jgi:alpha-ribazole phosphatase
MLTLVLTRHGTTDRSEPEQHLGQRIDLSINAAGRRQAEALARRLAPVRFDRVITSPLFRARETADLLVRRVPIEADPRLREMDYGAWEGRTYEQIDATDAEYRRDWELAPDRLACPGGESGNDVAERVRAFLADLLDEHRRWTAKTAFRAATSGGTSVSPARGRPILVVGHSTTNRIVLGVALGEGLRDFRKRFVQDHANLTALRWEDGEGPEDATLLLMNDVAHLRAPTEAPWG